MSGKIMGGVWDLELPRNKQLVLLAMADHADHNGEGVRPSFNLIAWKTGYSYQQVLRIVKALEKDRILVLVKSGKDLGKPNTYRINLDAGVKKLSFPEWRNGGSNIIVIDPKNGGSNIQESDPGLTSECDTGSNIQESDEPSLNRQNKQKTSAASSGDEQQASPLLDTFNAGDDITWPRDLRGSYGQKQYLHGTVVKTTAKQVTVRVAQADGEIIERSVKPESLLRGHVDVPPAPVPHDVETPENAPEHVAMIDAWWNALPQMARPYTPDGKPPYSEESERMAALVRRGFTRKHVQRYMDSVYSAAFWQGKLMTLKHIGDYLPAWASQHMKNGNGANRPAPPPPDPDCPKCGGVGWFTEQTETGNRAITCACRQREAVTS